MLGFLLYTLDRETWTQGSTELTENEIAAPACTARHRGVAVSSLLFEAGVRLVLPHPQVLELSPDESKHIANPPEATPTIDRVDATHQPLEPGTLADYVQEQESWVRLVEESSGTSSRPLETINAGIWAISLADELAILSRRLCPRTRTWSSLAGI